jgi:hypothetical protein
MKKEYDFSAARSNPYAERINREVTIRLDLTTIDYFKPLAAEFGIPYQTLINLYLRDSAASGRRLAMDWPSPPESEPGSRSAAARRRRRSSEGSAG